MMKAILAATAATFLLAGCSMFGGGDTEPPKGLTASAFAGPMAAQIETALGPDNLKMAEQAQYQALEYGRAGTPVTWNDPRSGNSGRIDVGQSYDVNRLDCREYTHTVYIGGRANVARGTACRQPNGVWRIVG
jgi:surface antigen